MAAPKEILDLVQRFELQLDSYKSGHYNETQLRREFLDPFFKALGWDIDNNAGYAEAYKDVIHEDAIKIGEATKAPDYCFRIGGTRKFFLEAKKPSVYIKNEPAPAFQLRRYAWTSKLPLSILSDFEEFAVYDCRIKPDQGDEASKARIQYFTFHEYADKWDEIASVFSRDAILKGSFDRYAESSKGKRGTADVDDAFLETIESWRSDLAKNLARKNPNLTQREINFAVQRIIDRIIFLRICEGRGIEDYGRLQALVNGDRVYPRLCELFTQADDRYNSGLFHFKSEKNRHEAPDELTLKLEVEDKLLKGILKSLYYPESPYVFSALPADILGQVYEQFLGKVIRLTDSHNAVVEEKPEVKKAGGVYYTPTYIVDYIVQNTVGKLIDDIITTCSSRREEALSKPASTRKKKSKDSPEPDLGLAVEAVGNLSSLPSASSANSALNTATKIRDRVAKLRILDPACGSGSFLLGAYEYLLKWHLDFYTANNPEHWAKGKRPALVQVSGSGKGNWRLTINERKRILLANIYGVDIDAQAVETTKLSLLLKVLEGETQQSLQPFFRTFHERALPDLGNNIKCGNSLIGPDFYKQPEMNLLSENERYRINVFDWKGEFPEIFDAGGFDAVIGNPPYVNAWELYASTPHIRDFINESGLFATAERHWDLYVLFLEKALAVTRLNGRVSFIIPYSYAIQKYAMASRKMILEKYEFESVVDLRKVRVFRKVPVITIVPVVVKRKTNEKHSVEILGPSATATKYHPGEIQRSHFVPQALLQAQHEQMLRIDLSDKAQRICQKIESNSISVGDICWVNYGAQMSSKEKGRFGKDHVLRDSCISSTCKKTVSGRNLYRYSVAWDGKYVEWKFASQMYGSREQAFFETDKLMIRDITGTHRLELTVDRSGLYCDHTILCALRSAEVASWKSVPDSSIKLSAFYSLDLLLGLLASRLQSAYYYWKLTGEGVRTGGGFHTYPKTIRQLQIFNWLKANASQRLCLNKIESLAKSLLFLSSKIGTTRTPQDKTSLERQIAATDAQIDRLVYELYDLTPEEIAIVEGKAASALSEPEATGATISTLSPKPKRTKKSPLPKTAPSPNPEQAWADSAHFYSGKEEAPPYLADADSPEPKPDDEP